MTIKVAFDFDLGIPVIPNEIKERVRQGEQIDIEILPQTSGFVQNALKHGVAGLWVDGGRVPTNDTLNGGQYSGTERADGSCYGKHRNLSPEFYQQPSGRWPANLIHDGSDEVVGLFPVARSAYKNMETAKANHRNNAQATWGSYGSESGLSYCDSGSAARFFYCAKASRKERGEGNNHPTVKPLALMRYLCRLTKTPTGGSVLDMFMGSGTTLVAAQEEGRRAVGIEIDEETCAIATKRLRQRTYWNLGEMKVKEGVTG